MAASGPAALLRQASDVEDEEARVHIKQLVIEGREAEAAALLRAAPVAPPASADVPRYQIDLDAPPRQRWAAVLADLGHHLPPVADFVSEMLGGGLLQRVVTGALALLNKGGLVLYSDELRGVAEASGLPLGSVVVLQLAYEAFAFCTSVVAPAADGSPLHVRTMDWEMPQLKPLTIEADFVSGGRTVFSATTWAGYVGVLTGVRPRAFSVSVNYRRTGDSAKDLLRNVARGMTSSWPVGFLVRTVLAEDASLAAAVGSLSQSKLIAPTYIVVAGLTDAALLTRDRNGDTRRWTLLRDGPIVQTNMDHWRVCGQDGDEDEWQDICESRRRHALVRAMLAAPLADGEDQLRRLWTVMRVPPVLAHDNVYTAAMVPATGLLLTQVEATEEDLWQGRALAEMSGASGGERRGGGARRF